MGQIQAIHGGLSKRRTCVWLRLRRSTVYEVSPGMVKLCGVHRSSSIIEMIKKVRRSHPAWGFRMIFSYLKNKGERIGKNRAHRLNMEAKLSLHRNSKKPRIKRTFQKLLLPEQINEGLGNGFFK